MIVNGEHFDWGVRRACALKGARFPAGKGALFSLKPAPALKKACATGRRKAPQFSDDGARA